MPGVIVGNNKRALNHGLRVHHGTHSDQEARTVNEMAGFGPRSRGPRLFTQPPFSRDLPPPSPGVDFVFGTGFKQAGTPIDRRPSDADGACPLALFAGRAPALTWTPVLRASFAPPLGSGVVGGVAQREPLAWPLGTSRALHAHAAAPHLLRVWHHLLSLRMLMARSTPPPLLPRRPRGAAAAR